MSETTGKGSQAGRARNSRKQKAPPKAWKPGQSGNPRGRPKVAAEVKELARQYTVRAIERLAELMESADSDAVCVRAAVALLDRAHGTPAQTVSVETATERGWTVTLDIPSRVCASGSDTATSMATPPNP